MSKGCGKHDLLNAKLTQIFNLQNNIKGAGKPTATKSFPAQNVKSGAGLGSGGGGSCPKPKLMNMFFFSIATFKIFFYQRPLLI